jgi:hypothetical protein
VPTPPPLDLSDPAASMRALIKARASLDGSDTVTWFTGNVHAWPPERPGPPLLGIEGYNIARAVETEGGWDLLTREAVFYLDPFRREPIDEWANPFTGETVEVVHIFNDPVNQRFRLQGPHGPWRLPVTGMGDDLYFNVDVLLAYPSPLPRAEFPEHSGDDTYRAAELFQFFCKTSEIADEANVNASCNVSWTRLGPWLPWMRMSDRPGMLVYHCRGKKLEGGYGALPDWIRERIDRDAPTYREAPRELTEPNETSWTYFRKLLASRA